MTIKKNVGGIDRMSLNLKEKELVAVGVSVAAGCKPCTNYHVRKVQETGAADEEIKQAISQAVCVRSSAKEIMESHGLKLLGIIQDPDHCGCTGDTTRIKELVSVGAAFAVNCTSNLEKHIAAAQTIGITDDEIKSVLDLALFIKGKAASHVDRSAERIGEAPPAEEESEDLGGCGCDDEAKATTAELKATDTTMAAVEEDDCGCGGGC